MMNTRLHTLVAAALLTLATVPASAALLVSGDSNIANDIGSNAGNQAFFGNIVEGTTVVVQDSTRGFLNTQATALVNHYNGAGYSATLLGAGSVLGAADLAGVDLFIGFAPDDAYSAGEAGVLAAFMAGGGNVLLTGENSSFPDLNAIINALLAALGSGMQIVDATVDGGFHTAIAQGPSPYLAGTAGFQYAATSLVTGGTGLFGTVTGNQTFLAVEGAVSPVPEPSSLLLAGGGLLLLGALRRRRA